MKACGVCDGTSWDDWAGPCALCEGTGESPCGTCDGTGWTDTGPAWQQGACGDCNHPDDRARTA